MKDYRALQKYSIDEWEEDVKWRASRLDFIWCMRDYAVSRYRDLGLIDEKDDFYHINDGEVARLASELYYSVDMNYYKSTIGNQNIGQQYKTYKNLQRMKENDIAKFLNKNNCNLYEYLKYKDADGYFNDSRKEEEYNGRFV